VLVVLANFLVQDEIKVVILFFLHLLLLVVEEEKHMRLEVLKLLNQEVLAEALAMRIPQD
jgi:hypothetical protein